jgi:hypothetical protein
LLADSGLPGVSGLLKLLEIGLDLFLRHASVGGEEGQVSGGEGGGGTAHGEHCSTKVQSSKAPVLLAAYLHTSVVRN